MPARVPNQLSFRTIVVVLAASFVVECIAWLLLRATPIDVGYAPGTSPILVFASGATVLLHYPAMRFVELLPQSRTLWLTLLFLQGWMVLFILASGLFLFIRLVR